MSDPSGNVASYNLNTSETVPAVIAARTLSFLHLQARLEVFHAHLGDSIRVWEKPSQFTRLSGLRNANVQGQENSCKTFTHRFFFLLTHIFNHWSLPYSYFQTYQCFPDAQCANFDPANVSMHAYTAET